LENNNEIANRLRKRLDELALESPNVSKRIWRETEKRLSQDDTSRGGHRRYYKIVDPDRAGDLLRKWSLN